MERPEVLYDEAAIARRVDELAARISRDYGEADGLCLVGVLKGAFIFLADLARRLSVPHRIDFVAVSSYGDSTSGGDLELLMDLKVDIAGRPVIVVDDILDRGATLHHLLALLRRRRPASLRTCVLVSKRKRRPFPLEVDYLGFEVPDVWIVGYGLDIADRHRTLPYLGVVPRRED